MFNLQPPRHISTLPKERASLRRLQRFHDQRAAMLSCGTRGQIAMPNPKHVEACFLCHQPFEFGSQVYQGRRIPEWDMMTCTSCYESNWDGIVPEVFPHLIPYLKSRGIEITLNASGRIDWPT